jgi:Conserved TM helix
MFFQGWTDIVASSLQNQWMGVADFLPRFIGALVVFILGLIVASALEIVIRKIFETIKFDSFLHHIGLTPYFERAGLKLRGSFFLGRLVFWFLVVVFLLASSDALGLYTFSAFLTKILLFVPSVVAAVLIMLATVVIASFARRVVLASVNSAQLHGAGFLGTLTWWAITVLGFVTALEQLIPDPTVINTLITGFIGMLALAGGLAFGLGGKDYANHLINKLRDRTESNH